MNPVLNSLLETGRATTATGEERELHSMVAPEEGAFLQDVIRHVRPRRSLEIGLAYGVSTLFICDALKEVGAERHVCIDAFQYGFPDTGLVRSEDKAGWEGIGMKNVREAGYGDLVELRNELSYEALPKLLAEGYRCQVAFIDGWHTFDYALVDFFYVDKMLEPGGVVVFDDTTYPSVRKVCRYVAINLPYSVFPGGDRGRQNPGPLRKVLKPELVQTDSSLGLSAGNWLAFRKEREDWLGNGEDGTRRWDDHHPF